ncbi:peptide-methionine (S)-S-oxide reductase [Dyella flava]|uniref:peptide-methionine (S)-S-oxide reductase n=1 Tax=Dyella flava TaxID=1920170 RepID=A0ABS2K696_9GAMM|nr:peptide-methionine (S)-S-oxide reductase [Dyella flava]GLQ49495.1 hypothetical protein GCM10010872_09440 [Dyella flava]
MAGHAEVVRVIHGLRQGDARTPCRSAVYTSNAVQRHAVQASASRFQAELARAGHGSITTEIAVAGPFCFVEDEHQQ